MANYLFHPSLLFISAAFIDVIYLNFIRFDRLSSKMSHLCYSAVTVELWCRPQPARQSGEHPSSSGWERRRFVRLNMEPCAHACVEFWASWAFKTDVKLHLCACLCSCSCLYQPCACNYHIAERRWGHQEFFFFLSLKSAYSLYVFLLFGGFNPIATSWPNFIL